MIITRLNDLPTIEHEIENDSYFKIYHKEQNRKFEINYKWDFSVLSLMIIDQ
jgi:hypothetical protein